MKIEPYKLKAEIVVIPNGKGTGITAKLAYVCDPDKNVECNKLRCRDFCTMTTNIEYAKEFKIDE